MLAAALATAGVCALVAQASWRSQAAAGPQVLQTASLGAPTGLTTSRGSCFRSIFFTTNFSWRDPSPLGPTDGYVVEVATSSGGPYSTLVTASGGTATSASYTSWFTGWSTTYYVRVRATARTWTSGPSAVVSFRSPSQYCS